jgi:L-threonylcarbamoyladenylate synthase
VKVFQNLHDPEVVLLLKSGAVGVLPTDTVYGIVCRAANEQSAARLYALKKDGHEPGTLISLNIDQCVDLGLKRRYLSAVERYWPSPVSVIIPMTAVNYLRRDAEGLAVRLPSDEDIRSLLSETGSLITSSANLPGKPVANSLTEAQAYFGELVDFYVDGGDLSGRLPSTTIRIIDDAVEVLLQGAVKIDETGRVIQ